MSFLVVFAMTAFVLQVFYYCVFALAILRKRNDIADIAWGIGFILVALMALLLSLNFSTRYLLLLIMVAIWGTRLGVHIFLRNKGREEDWRYRNWRKTWGKWWELRAYLHVFLVQASLLLIIAVPIIWTAVYAFEPLGFLDYLGLSVWLIGFLFEAIADYQLLKFKNKKENKDKIMQTGLWKYSRHPNYFGETLLWWGVFLISLAAKDGFLTIFGPLTITYLLTSVSGVPMLEKKYKNNKQYQAYAQKTSVFLPLPAKK